MVHMKVQDDADSHVDQCYRALRQLIVSCDIAPGARITEGALIERLGFGRTPVREALLRLRQERLVETRPRSGYVIRPLTRKSVADFFAVWRTIAPLLAKLGVPKLSAEQRMNILKLGSARDAVRDDDWSALSRIATAFFDILLKAADNEPLAYIYSHLGAEMERIYGIFFRTEEGRRWLGSGTEIAAFGNVSDEETAFRLIASRATASEDAFMALMAEWEASGDTRYVFSETAANEPLRRTTRTAPLQ